MMNAATLHELSPSMKAWVAENLALGSARDQIRTVLMDSGVPEALAEQELDAAESHPYMHAMKRCVVLLNKRESLLKTLDYYRHYNPAHNRIERTTLPPFADFLRDYLSVNRPGLFPGSFDHWPARHWTPRTMLDLVGADTGVEVEANRGGDPHHMQNGDRLRRTMRFADFVSHVESGSGNDVYMTANSFTLDSSPFGFVREQIGNIGDGYLASAHLEKSMFLWMGPAGIVTGMHQDLNHIFFCQIHGRKRFRLYPATQVPYVYNRKWVFSPVDPLEPAVSAYPLFDRATVFDVTVEEGDMLYIPIGWWHHVIGETASISVSLTNIDRMPNHFIEYPPDLPEVID